MAACRSKMNNKGTALTPEQQKILEALKEAQEPLSCKEIGERVGLTGNQVSCRIRALKSKNLVESPVRCKYTISTQVKS